MNRSKWAWMVLPVAVLLALAGCDSITGEDDSSSGDEFILISQSGDTYTLTSQTWREDCRLVDGFDFRSVLEIKKGKIEFTDYTYTSTGLTCDAGESLDDEGSAKLKFVGDLELAGWSDTSTTVSAPLGQDGATNLDDPPTASVYDVTISGTTFRTVWFMDDTDPNNLVFYGGTDSPSADCATADGEGCLRTDKTHTRID